MTDAAEKRNIPFALRAGRLAIGLIGGFCALFAHAGLLSGLEDPDYDAPPWQESKIQLPPYPQDESLYSFYVSPTAAARFFIDIPSLSVENEGVVRYTLVVISPSGVRNVSFEGMRCQTKMRRIYAVGRQDGTWSPTQNSGWRPIAEAAANRHHAALYTEFFCPGGVMNYKVEDIRRLLKKEGHPP